MILRPSLIDHELPNPGKRIRWVGLAAVFFKDDLFNLLPGFGVFMLRFSRQGSALLHQRAARFLQSVLKIGGGIDSCVGDHLGRLR
ncbi:MULTISPECIES: hypothetical protein [Rhizobium/Agrobacterium group]|uniref:hypothetical protein n=1 Tax=Rhizobium/Agrobacterium group TaxID=227290 RepID=UPI00130323BE|nr:MULTISPECIES: hypothetical protein [Rhizobium/Agrobacterium group]NSZ43847.1 hypothetical protein [Agrobacterium vitis]NTA27595.1 hypothetical protein [Allorhizobium ampelinum]